MGERMWMGKRYDVQTTRDGRTETVEGIMGMEDLVDHLFREDLLSGAMRMRMERFVRDHFDIQGLAREVGMIVVDGRTSVTSDLAEYSRWYYMVLHEVVSDAVYDAECEYDGLLVYDVDGTTVRILSYDHYEEAEE